MPARTPGRSRSTLAVTPTSYSQGGTPSSGQTTRSTPGTIWRHQLQQVASYKGAAHLIVQNEYAYLELAKFTRTFGAPTADVPPTPIATTSNFQSVRVFNDSRIGQYYGKILLTNKSAQPIYIDVYEVALSFYDAVVWSVVAGFACPVSIDTTLGGVQGGQVSNKTIAVGLVDPTYLRDYRFVQRYLHHKGTLVIPQNDAGSPVELIVNRIPPKCRRANTGMFWCLYFGNDALKNNGDISVRIEGDLNFNEYPSGNRNVNFPG